MNKQPEKKAFNLVLEMSWFKLWTRDYIIWSICDFKLPLLNMIHVNMIHVSLPSVLTR